MVVICCATALVPGVSLLLKECADPWSISRRRVAERHAAAALYRRRRSVGLIDDQVLLLCLVVHVGFVGVGVVGSAERALLWDGVEALFPGLRGEEVTG